MTASADAWFLRGRRHAAEPPGTAQPANTEQAIHCLRAGLALEPENANAWDDLGLLLMRQQRALDAEPCHRRATALAPLDAAPHTHLGFALEAQARFEEAHQSHLCALACEPDHPLVHTNLGNVLGFLDRNLAAEFHHRESIRLAPTLATAHGNLGVLLADQRRDQEAERHLRQAIALRPGYPLARLNLGFLLLALGRFDEGWALHEARHDPLLPNHGIPPPPWPIPAWQGESLAGRSLLVWAEQGFGDQIQFARYLPLLKAAGAARVTLVCQRPLLTLFETLSGVDRLVAADVVDNAFCTGDVDLSDHDLWAFALTLPLHLGTTTPACIPAAVPYLRAPRAHSAPQPGRVARGHDGEDGNSGRRDIDRSDDQVLRRTNPTCRVGLVWRGNPRHHNDADRSLPGLETLAPLWSVAGVEFVSLQTGAAAAAAVRPPPGQPLLHLAPDRDFAATAEALVGLDLLVCVDTSSAHLAGALGVPCWLLLTDHRTDWRWLRSGDASPWYPGSMRLFRQKRRGDWAEVIERVRTALQERVPGTVAAG